MILTGEIVEKGARALHELGHGPLEACRAQARACLEAALPHVVERCAREIEDTPSRIFALTFHGGGTPGRSLNTLSVKRELADRIRSLLNGENENGPG
ncbi:MAG: hypothetical protein AB7S92_19585 [Parvibaculaceae bacterium]